MFNSAKCVGFPPQLKRLDGKFGLLLPLPLDVYLYDAGDPESPALKQLRHIVTEHALVELAGKSEVGPLSPPPTLT